MADTTPTEETRYARRDNIVNPLSTIDLTHLPAHAREEALAKAAAELEAQCTRGKAARDDS